MSIPVTTCLMIKACTDQDAYKRLLQRMRINLKCGHYSVHDCPHDPPCKPPTEEEQQELANRLAKDLELKQDASAG